MIIQRNDIKSCVECDSYLYIWVVSNKLLFIVRRNVENICSKYNSTIILNLAKCIKSNKYHKPCLNIRCIFRCSKFKLHIDYNYQKFLDNHLLHSFNHDNDMIQMTSYELFVYLYISKKNFNEEKNIGRAQN